MAYGTIALLGQYLPQVSGQDILLERILARATGIVDGVLGFAFTAYGSTATERDVSAGNGGEYLYLPAYKAGSLASIYQVSGRGTEDEDDTEEIEDYVEGERWQLWRAAGWPRRTWYRATAIWGPGAAPDEVVEATLEVAVNIYRGRDAGNWDQQGAEGGGNLSYARALTWAQRAVLDRVKMQFSGAWPAR